MLKSLELRSLSIGVLITMAVVAFMLVASSAPAQWEYKVLTLLGGSSHDAALNRLGKEGWEVAGYAHTPGSHMSNEDSRYLLKRAKRSGWKFW